MSRQRKKIRKFILDLVRRADTEADNNVFFERDLKIDDKDLPSIGFYFEGESISMYSDQPREYLRKNNLVAEIYASKRTEEEVLDQLDDIGAEIEELLCSIPTSEKNEIEPGCYLLSDIMILNSVYALEEGGQKPIGSLKITFSVEYTEQIPALNNAVDDFVTADATYVLDPSVDVEDANDRITMPQ